MTLSTLNEILKEVAEGNENSFRDLFHFYKGRVYAYAMHFTHTVQVSEEIVQEVFIKLWLHKETLGGIANMEGYLYTITRNLCFDYLKKLAHVKVAEQEWGLAAEMSEEDVEATVVCNNYKYLVRQALELLPPQQKKIYTLSFYHGQKHEEIARYLRISRNTVKVHLTKARATVRRYLSTHLESIILILILMLT